MIIDVDCIDFEPDHKGQIPAEQFKALGIRYKEFEAHPMFDCIRLIGCSNVPSDLPSWYRIRSDLA